MVKIKTKKQSLELREFLNRVFVFTQTQRDMPKVLGGLGIAIVSTNKGVVTDKVARELNVGGEVSSFRLVGLKNLTNQDQLVN